ncbi:MAG TPA: septum site-determining protein MinC [Cyanobacteria bacterium UBA8156]|jgi:septum site-determining protein MinC|nr:septum site-determining protein MinC [Cyanobacteria bacterium UBA8156]
MAVDPVEWPPVGADATAPEEVEGDREPSEAMAGAKLRVTLPQESFPGLLDLASDPDPMVPGLPPLTDTAQLISLLVTPPEPPVLPPPPPPIVRVTLTVQDGILQVFLPKEEHFQRNLPEELPEKLPEKLSETSPKSALMEPVWEEMPGDEATIWQEMLTQLGQMLGLGEYPAGLAVCLQAGDRLLDGRQLQDLAAVFGERELVWQTVATQRRQTAIAAATAGYSVVQGEKTAVVGLPKPEPLYLKTTLRSGSEVRHGGDVIVVGDVNRGAEIIAGGDIVVWGKLQGSARAGCNGDRTATISALHLSPTLLRIGDFVARVEVPSSKYVPEVAYVEGRGSGKICIIDAATYGIKSPPR